MTLLLYKFLTALFILLSTIAVLYPLRKKHVSGHTESLEWGEAFASGIFLGVAFLHMLPEASHYFLEAYPQAHFPIAESICVGGFLLMLFLERLSLAKRDHHANHSLPWVLTIILIIHSLTEGAALGISATFSETLILFVAIIAHKTSESFAFCMVMMRHQFSFKRIAIIIFFFAWMTPIGIGLGSYIQQFTFAEEGALIAALFNAFAAGTFLYISTLHHIQFHSHTHSQNNLIPLFCLLMGVFIMAVLAFWV